MKIDIPGRYSKIEPKGYIPEVGDIVITKQTKWIIEALPSDTEDKYIELKHYLSKNDTIYFLDYDRITFRLHCLEYILRETKKEIS